MFLLQTLIFNLLNGNLSYDGNDISVYDEKISGPTRSGMYVVLSTQQESEGQEMTDCTWSTESSIDIEIQHNSDFNVTKLGLSDLTNQILGLIFITPGQHNLGTPDHFQVLNLRRSRAITRNFSITDNQSIVAKIITLTATIVQQSP